MKYLEYKISIMCIEWQKNFTSLKTFQKMAPNVYLPSIEIEKTILM